LQVEAERVYVVPPLALPASSSEPADLSRVDAVALFVDRAREARPGFGLTPANAASVAELCVRLGGLPLALELAAARVSLLSPRAILTRVGRWLDLLQTSAHAAPERHRSLRAAIEWSYALLAPPDRAVFRRLAVFGGGCTIDGAEAVAGGSDVDVVTGVESLLRAHLIRADGAAGDEPRFRMLETIRAYGLDCLRDDEGEHELRERHAHYYRGLAERAETELRGPDQARWLELLDAEYENIRQALAWAAEHGDPDCGLRTGAALWRHWQVRGHSGEGREQLGRLLAGGRGSPAARAAAHLTVGRCAWMEGDLEMVERSVAASLPVHRELGDTYSVAFALTILGAVRGTHGAHDQARELLAEALAVARTAGDAWCASLAMGYTGSVLLVGGELAAARTILEEALRGVRRCGDHRGVFLMLVVLARVALADGDRERARARVNEALMAYGALPDLWAIATALELRARIALEDGHEGEAAAFLSRSLRAAWTARARPELVRVLTAFGRLAALRHDPVRATRLLASASALADSVTGYPLQPQPVDLETRVAQLRATLASDTFDVAWAEGSTMPLDDVISYALEDEPDLALGTGGSERDAPPHAQGSFP
jgi:predicted ATPase